MEFDDFIKSLQEYSESEYPITDPEVDTDEMIDPGLLMYSNMHPYSDEATENKSDSGLVRIGVKDADNKDSSLHDETKFQEQITDEDVSRYAGILYPQKKVLRSLIHEIFTPQQLLDIEKITRCYTISNNSKVGVLKNKLRSWGIEFAPLNPGTNRWGIMIDGYVIKVALDADGKIDNLREFIYSMQLQPYVLKCYETAPNGVVGVYEYLEVFSLDDLYKNQERMREILTLISDNFLVGDVGISSTNYLNWGYRDGGIPVILDFAYIYSVKFKTFTCTCSPGAFLHYDRDFNNLICPICGKKYSFRDIRKRITRKDQSEEIGDVTKKGYIMSSSEEEVVFNPNFTEGAVANIKRKLLKIKKKNDKKIRQRQLNHEVNPDDALSAEEIVEAIARGEML